jgi:gamma-glutamyl:cysteine ligase YbdK (ATP-grasp superfamily)
VGLSVDRDHFGEDEYARFAVRLREDLHALGELLAREGFGIGAPSLGAELEMSMVSGTCSPTPINEEVLAETRDPRFTVELNRFNLECNTLPVSFRGAAFSSLGKQLDECLTRLRAIARAHGARIAVTGILPTLTPEDLSSSALTDLPRFRALSAGIRRLRKAPFHVRVDGDDPLDVRCDDVTYEGAATSLQIHLRVNPAEFNAVYNAVQLATAPALAVSVNSPTFLGHRLWDETRIALFSQAVDDRPEHAQSGAARVPRVCFGLGWLERGPLDLFRQSVELHEPLLPVLSDEDPLAITRRGGVPQLRELRLHHGTVWRWNRAVYDPAGGGHLRIEMRALPSGPTVVDMMASAAFLVGLSLDLARDAGVFTRMPFALARANFFEAAQRSLDAVLSWPIADRVVALPARELIPMLLPAAFRGLVHAGIDAGECERLLELIERRVATGQTGARWQRARLEQLEDTLGRRGALARMLSEYVDHSEQGAPVHSWPMS